MLVLAAQGWPNSRIAEEMGTRHSTVKSYLHSACVKLNARNRTQAIVEALKQAHLADEGLFTMEELVEWWSSLGPEVLEEAARILRQRLKQEQDQSGAE